MKWNGHHQADGVPKATGLPPKQRQAQPPHGQSQPRRCPEERMLANISRRLLYSSGVLRTEDLHLLQSSSGAGVVVGATQPHGPRSYRTNPAPVSCRHGSIGGLPGNRTRLKKQRKVVITLA